MSSEIYTLHELSEASGVEPRTIRSWIAKELLPGASSRGSDASYDQRHLDRILAVQVFKAAHRLTLEEIRLVLLRLTDEVIHGVASGEIPPHALELGIPGPETSATDAGQKGATESALDYVRSLLHSKPGSSPRSVRYHSKKPLRRRSPAGSSGRLERLAVTLTKLARRRPQPKARSEWWASVAITPDLELRARGLDSGDLPHLEEVADLLRLLIQEDLHE